MVDPASPPDRRRLLAGMLTAYTASLIPWAVAQPVTSSGQGAFIAVSAILLGRTSLDEASATRLYDALAADDPGFPAAVQALLTFINDGQIDPAQLQATLDQRQTALAPPLAPALAPLPRKIVTAWYLGVVGEGEQARCLAYETSLMTMVVGDRLRPPTYAYGSYGSWTSKPA
jgi:hypothetical protein